METHDIPQSNPTEGVEDQTDNGKNNIKIRRKENQERGTALEYIVFDIDDVLSESFSRNVFELIKKQYESETEEYKEIINNTLCSNESYEDLESLVKLVRKYAESEQNEYNKYLFLHLPGYYLTVKKIGKKIVILPTHLTHTLTGSTRRESVRDDFISKFEDLNNILQIGFKLPGESKFVDTNAYLTGDKQIGHKTSYASPLYLGNIFKEYKTLSNPDITSGDGYSIGFISDDLQNVSNYSGFKIEENGFESFFESDVLVKSSKSSGILAVNIFFSEELDDNKREEKISFYKKEIYDRFKVTIRFFTVDESQKMTRIK